MRAFHGSEAHRCVDALAAHHGCHRGAVAYVAGDDALLGRVDAQHFAHAAAHIAVARAVEAVAANAVFRIIFVGAGHTYMPWPAWSDGRPCRTLPPEARRHKGRYGVDARHVGGVVEGSYVVALADFVLHLVGDEYASLNFSPPCTTRWPTASISPKDAMQPSLGSVSLARKWPRWPGGGRCGRARRWPCCRRRACISESRPEDRFSPRRLRRVLFVVVAFEVESRVVFHRAGARVENEDFHFAIICFSDRWPGCM